MGFTQMHRGWSFLAISHPPETQGRCEETPWPKKVGIVVPVAFPCRSLLPKGPAGSTPDSIPSAQAHQSHSPRGIDGDQTRFRVRTVQVYFTHRGF